jgi:hypothetical protein
MHLKRQLCHKKKRTLSTVAGGLYVHMINTRRKEERKDNILYIYSIYTYICVYVYISIYIYIYIYIYLYIYIYICVRVCVLHI